jgi:hypothetical protein
MSSTAMLALIVLPSGPILQAIPSTSCTGGIPDFIKNEGLEEGWTDVKPSVWTTRFCSVALSSSSHETTLGMFLFS